MQGSAPDVYAQYDKVWRPRMSEYIHPAKNNLVSIAIDTKYSYSF